MVLQRRLNVKNARKLLKWELVGKTREFCVQFASVSERLLLSFFVDNLEKHKMVSEGR